MLIHLYQVLITVHCYGIEAFDIYHWINFKHFLSFLHIIIILLLICMLCIFKLNNINCHFSKRLSFSKEHFDLKHVDVWESSKHGYKFSITIVGDFSRDTWVHLLTHTIYACSFIKTFVDSSKLNSKKISKIIRKTMLMRPVR